MKTWTIALASMLALATAAQPADARQKFKANLDGAQEVPVPVDTEAVGQFDLLVNDDLTEGRFQLIVRNLPRVTRAHLHCNVAGQNGPIFVHLMGDLHTLPSSIDVDGKWFDHATLTDASISDKTTSCGATLADVVDAIKAGMVYVNVHTTDFPGGSIRGQLQ